MYKAIIIDDEEMARTLLSGMINEYVPEITIAELCKDLASGVKAIHKHKPDIVFLDIEMPGHSGLELLDFFDPESVNFSIIFVTAYNQYAIQAFKLSAVDYLLKPIEVEDLTKAIELFKINRQRTQLAGLKHNLSSHKNKKIGLNTVSSVLFVSLEDILFFQAEGSYTRVYTKDGKQILASKGLKHFENTLSDQSEFFRCHKSYIVNIPHINEYVKTDGGHLRIGNYEIGISTDKIAEVLNRLQAAGN